MTVTATATANGMRVFALVARELEVPDRLLFAASAVGYCCCSSAAASAADDNDAQRSSRCSDYECWSAVGQKCGA